MASCFGTPETRDKNQTGSGMYHPIVKERELPGRLEGLQTNPDTTHTPSRCQGANPAPHESSVEIPEVCRSSLLDIRYT